jgi:ABC-type lipoprotein export system ATPase subunit
MADQPAAEAQELTRAYSAGRHRVPALIDVTLAVAAGEVVAIMGPSGSGKSTLVHLLAGLDAPDRGSARLAGVDWSTLEGAARARFRRRHCGFVGQGMTLLPQATAAENVAVPLLLDGAEPATLDQRVNGALENVGLTGSATKLPDQLSGGEQQRVAIARALIHAPSVLLADEPTGSLDSETSAAVTALLVASAREQGCAVVLVTHNPAVARHADRLVTLHSGRLRSDIRRPRPHRLGSLP